MGKNFGDISNKNTWSKLPAANTLIHLAGQTFVPKSWSKPGEFFRSNVLGTISCLFLVQNLLDFHRNDIR